MVWNEDFVTGIDTIDAQHHALVDMINDVAPQLALGREQAKREVAPLLDKLIQYAAHHFKHEEDLMTEVKVLPEYFQEHQRTHLAFVDEVLLMRQQYEQGIDSSGNDLLRFLSSWLSFHILSEDKRLASQVLAIRQGNTAEHAYAQLGSVGGAPNLVYTTALVELFTMLTEKNRTLVEANAQVRAVQADLEAVNRSLESRVTERTHELQDVNKALETERQALVESMTRLEQTQNQLLQSEKMAAVGQLAAGVAHEINNPIGFVNSNMGSLATYVQQLFEVIDICKQVATGLSAEKRQVIETGLNKIEYDFLRQDIPDLLKESRDGLARVKSIVSDLRDFSHADDGQYLPIDLNQALESALNMVSNEIKYKAEVVQKLSVLPPVVCIGSQINQVLVNLLVNAAQAIQTKGKISVSTGVAGESVWVEIGDTGCGMTEEVQKRIFEPFYTTKPVGKGTGLGLSISWEIIKRHHGNVEVHSKPGEGTTFRISLPIGPM
jgi:hemerythrin-like metal-binding protein